MGHEEDAYVQLTQAINLGSKWAGDYINRGLLHYRRHNYRGALSDYDQAVKLAPREADTYYNRGVMRQEVGDYNRALEDFNTAIECKPERSINIKINIERLVVVFSCSCVVTCVSERIAYSCKDYFVLRIDVKNFVPVFYRTVLLVHSAVAVCKSEKCITVFRVEFKAF